jgi:NADH:ubiquinone oxidoreductase subunit 4 (subunit M)
MTILGIPILSLLIFFPIVGAIILLFINQEKVDPLCSAGVGANGGGQA